MDWGIGQGYMGLFTTVNKREAAKDELNVLTMLDQQMKADRVEKEQNQLKEQAYYAEISKFADQLLAPDRDRINKRSKLLAGAVREQIKMYGGDLTKFFANGGHNVLANYKSAILNSEETSTFMDNKKNMERILEMQSKGMGHLINQTDLYNLNNYQKNGGGKITFTGMLNQIDLPNLDNWDKGQKVPVEAILAHGQNRLKFLGNYKLTYPGAEYPPNEAELKRFVSESYANLEGTNWQRPLEYQKTAFDQRMRKAGHDLNVAQFNEGNKQWYMQFNANEEKRLFDQELSLAELEIEKYKSGLDSIYGRIASEGGTDGMSDSEKNQLIDDTYNWIGTAEQMTSDIDYQVNQGKKNATEEVWKEYAVLFGKSNGFDKFNTFYNDYSKGGYGGFFNNDGPVGRAIKKATGSPAYKVRGGVMLINGVMAQQATKGILNYNEDGTVKVDLGQMPDAYDASGRRIVDYDHRGKGFLMSNYEERIADRKFKVRGIVGGFTTQDENRKTVLLMDKKSGNKDYDARLLKGAQKRATMLVALESEQGDVIYKPIETNSERAILSEWAGSNISAVRKARTYGNRKAESIRFNSAQQKEALAASYNYIKNNPQARKRMEQQVRMIPGAAASGPKYLPLSYSFYGAISSRDDVSLEDALAGDAFNQIMSYMAQNKPLYGRFKNLIENPKTNQKEVIDFIKSTGLIEEGFANDWKKSFDYINSKK